MSTSDIAQDEMSKLQALADKYANSPNPRWKFCPECGLKLGDKWEYCSKCGTKVGARLGRGFDPLDYWNRNPYYPGHSYPPWGERSHTQRQAVRTWQTDDFIKSDGTSVHDNWGGRPTQGATHGYLPGVLQSQSGIHLT